MSDEAREALVTKVAREIFNGKRNLSYGGYGSEYQRGKAEKIIDMVSKHVSKKVEDRNGDDMHVCRCGGPYTDGRGEDDCMIHGLDVGLFERRVDSDGADLEA